MELYRAIPSSRLDVPSKGIARQSTIRVPSNVPYVVDNLWEWLRPEAMPSRRHAIYASPSAELALANASAPLADGDRYVACRVIVDPADIRIAQLLVRDAREHSDIRLISRWVGRHAQAIAQLELEKKQQLAPLFMPGLRADELEKLIFLDELVAEFCKYSSRCSTFWSEAASHSSSDEGELFFELISAEAFYYLEPMA